MKKSTSNKHNVRPTICADCQFHMFLGEIWHEQFCTAVEAQQSLDFVTGEMEYEFGRKYPFCLHLNDGKCPLFQPDRVEHFRWCRSRYG